MVPVARQTDKHACPLCKVVTPIVSGGSGTADGLPIARVGDKAACGAVITQGSSMATCDGKAVAYLGSTSSHGGKIITGSGSAKVIP